jgi:hypothetical protein
MGITILSTMYMSFNFKFKIRLQVEAVAPPRTLDLDDLVLLGQDGDRPPPRRLGPHLQDSTKPQQTQHLSLRETTGNFRL